MKNTKAKNDNQQVKAIFIDMDDTLIVNQVLYEHAQAMMSGYMHHFGVKKDEFDAVFSKIDKDLFPELGYSRERMPRAFENTLKHFIPNADDDMVETVRGFAETIFNTKAKGKPDIETAINILADRYPVYLVTQGDYGVQANRVSHLPYLNRLKDVFIVGKKDKKVFEDLTKKLKLDPKNVVMIGDSLRSDIIPATEAGLSAMWIEAHNSHHETGKTELPKRAYKFSSLLEVARHLAHWGKPSHPHLKLPEEDGQKPSIKKNFPNPKM